MAEDRGLGWLWAAGLRSSPSTLAPDRHQCSRCPPQQRRRPPPCTPAWHGPASPHLTGAAPPTPASAHLPRPYLCARAAQAARARARAPKLALSNVRSALFSQCGHRRLGREGGRGRGEGWEWVSARAARPSWFPGCARRWRSSCSCSSSREDGGGVRACEDLRVGAERDPGHSGSAGREQRKHEGIKGAQAT